MKPDMERAISIEVGAYRFAERLGEGGVGQVYRAHGPTGVVAVKILGPSADFDNAARARFGREVRALGELAHPHIVPLLDHGFDDELGPYLVMPLLQGCTLRRRFGGQRLGPDAGLLLARPLVAALTALHAAGYVHRDLKPENVMVTDDARLMLIDFGLAFRDGMTKHTDTGAAAGTVGYMAPEQIEGRRVTASADIFALGVMLYEWITGRRPFARDRASEEVSAALAGAFVPVGELEQRTAATTAELVARCLSRDPLQRPTAMQLLTEIDRELAWPAAATATSAVQAHTALVDFCADAAAFETALTPLRLDDLLSAAHRAQLEQRPFAALAYCDRGMAYARSPEQAKPFRDFVHGLETPTTHPPQAAGPVTHGAIAVASNPAVAVTTATSTADSNRAAVVATRSTALPSETPRHPRRRFGQRTMVRLAAIASAGVVAGWLVWPRPTPQDPWASATVPRPPPTAEISAHRTADNQTALALVGTLASTFNRAMDRIDRSGTTTTVTAAQPAATPMTATGWLALAETQPAATATASVQRALELQPKWDQAEDALCQYMGAAELVGATAACELAVANHPKAWRWIGLRGIAQIADAKYAGAIRDLTDAINHNEDPAWRVARGIAFEKRGNLEQALADFSWACRRGLESACARAKRP
ncbi:MAG: serine/threonine protein kinase [Kofleriaceae bacterium]|nr:serine/threonine protein kinase [Kofleriaceae bacterium]